MEGLLSSNLLSKASIFGSSGGSNIKSYQSGVFTLSTLTGNITIASVGTSKSIVITRAVYSNNTGDVATFEISSSLSSSTNIALTRYNPAPVSVPTVLIYWEVIEFNNVKSKQTGTMSVSSNSSESTQTISNVNPIKCLAFATRSVDTNLSPNQGQHMFGIKVASSTSIAIRQQISGVTCSYEWQVIEFN